MRRAALGAAVLLLAASACTFPGGTTGSVRLTATFDDVGDLVTQHSVQMADVHIGSVDEIELTDDFRAKVTMSIEDGLRVPKNSQALLRTTSLLGEKFIELRPLGDPDEGPFLTDGDVVEDTSESPELEFVAEQAIEVLGAVTSTDIATLIETGATAFDGRGDELALLIGDLSVISGTLAEQTGNIVKIIDGLDRATRELAAADTEIAALLTNLSETTTVLAANRQRAVDALAELTRLAKVQNDAVLRPYRDEVDQQIGQIDLILAEVVRAKGEVANLVDWIDRFTVKLPKGIPGDYAQVFSWFEPAVEDDRVGQP